MVGVDAEVCQVAMWSFGVNAVDRRQQAEGARKPPAERPDRGRHHLHDRRRGGPPLVHLMPQGHRMNVIDRVDEMVVAGEFDAEQVGEHVAQPTAAIAGSATV